jgi:hypothetical protein
MPWETHHTYVRSRVPHSNPASYWGHALREHLAGVDLVAFLSDYTILDVTWWELLSAPIRQGRADWSWGRVESRVDNAVRRRWGGPLDPRQLLHNCYISTSGALFRLDQLRRYYEPVSNDLAIYHYKHDLILRTAISCPGEFVDSLVAVEHQLEPYPDEVLAKLHPNEQRIHTGWWEHHKTKFHDQMDSRSVPHRTGVARLPAPSNQ